MTTPTTPWDFPMEEVWPHLDPDGLIPVPWEDFRHGHQMDLLHGLRRDAPFEMTFIDAGRSVEMRQLPAIEFGEGPRRVMLWARQHGNEPDCSAALNAALGELVRHADSPVCETILKGCRLCVLPMVNPDGVSVYTRQNLSGVDLNRDAVALSQPESRALVGLKDTFAPEFAFNLHDMSNRKANVDGRLVALAFQAGPFEASDKDNETRLRAKTIISRIAQVIRRQAPDNIARYNAPYMHRAFGDSMMRWGVSSILIESGGWFGDEGGDEFVRRLHALAILAGLHAIATGQDHELDAKAYASIPLDTGDPFLDLLFKGGRVHGGAGTLPFVGDVGVNVDLRHRRREDKRQILGFFEALGDLEDLRGKDAHDLRGLTVMPGMVGMAPGWNFQDCLPRPAEMESFVRAGVTTLAVSFGPFSAPHDREAFLDNVRGGKPPLNIVALERVESLDEILRRQGITELAGMTIGPRLIRAHELMEFLHLYHPANPATISEEDAQTPLQVDLLFFGSMWARRTHVHLMFTPLAPDMADGMLSIQPSMLRQLAVRFLRHPNQLSYSRAGFGRLPEFLPIQLSPVGFAPGRLPETDHASKVMRRFNKGDDGSIAMIVNMTSRLMARALGLDQVGAIRIGMRADFMVLRNEVLDPDKTQPAPPRYVVLNGQLAIAPGMAQAASVQGVLHLAR